MAFQTRIGFSGSLILIIIGMLSPEAVESQVPRQSQISSISSKKEPDVPEQTYRRFVFPGSELLRGGQKSSATTTKKPDGGQGGNITTKEFPGGQMTGPDFTAGQSGQKRDEGLANNEVTTGSEGRTKRRGNRTDVTWQMFDLASANLYPLGDINRELPDTMTAIKFYCRNRDNWFNIIEQWVDKRFSDEIRNPASSVVNSVAFYYLRSIRAKNDEFCQDRNAMQDFIDNATMVNLATKKMWRARKEYVNLLIKSVFQFDKIDYRFICCGYYIYEQKTSDSVDFRVRAWLRDYIFAYHTSLLEFHCQPIRRNSNLCKTFGVEQDKTKQDKRTKQDTTSGQPNKTKQDQDRGEYPSRRFKRPPFVSVQHPQLEILVKDFVRKGQSKSLSAIAKASNTKDPIAQPAGNDDVKFESEFINQKQHEDDIFDKAEELKAKKDQAKKGKRDRINGGQRALDAFVGKDVNND